MSRFRYVWTLLLACAVLGLSFAWAEPGGEPEKTKPRLAVLVVFDQMRGDYLTRWEKLYGEGGFRRLQKEGAWYKNCHYPYAGTLTAPGHASLATGTSPYKHGIIANEWWDRSSGKIVSAIESARHRPVPAPADSARVIFGVAPVRRQQPSLGDALLEATDGKAKVVSLSIKDRAAILLAALRALCFWFSTYTGMFGSSTYYNDTLPGWVNEFNRGKMADRWFEQKWDRLRPDLDYARFSGPDDNPAEGIGILQGRTFPHSLKGGSPRLGRGYYQAMTNSPFGSELLLAFAKKAIEAERLGRRDTPDLLCLSFSSNDLVGHCWGPDSQEVMDVTLRSDLIVKELLEFLDAKVGRGKYVLAISADHGICPIPEVARAQGKEAGRVSPFTLEKSVFFLDKKFGNGDSPPWVEAVVGGQIYLRLPTLKKLGLKPAVVEKALADWLVQQPGIKAAYTRTQLMAGPIKGDPIGESVRLSFHPERSGDVVVVLQPYHLLSPPVSSPRLAAYRTTHGSPHPYDTHVPLLIYGPGIRPGPRDELVRPQAVTAILARSLGIRPPAGAEVPVPDGLFE
jgi:predicted AlkP superfamily pyrophosphatase or phosphodiesterase